MLAALMFAFAQVPAADLYSIDQVRGKLEAFLGYRFTLCGEVSPDLKVIQSERRRGIHGQAGIKLRGYAATPGRDQCVTGYLVREDGYKPHLSNGPRNIIITDSAVQPDYVFVVDRR
jgi:hypothetical protein